MKHTDNTSVAHLFLRRCSATPDGQAFRYPGRGGWESLTWSQVGDRVREIAAGLSGAFGLREEERCAILASTRVEWILIDLGILCAGGATTTIYPASTAAECAFILEDSASAFAFVEDDAQAAKVASNKERLPNLRRVFVIDGTSSDDDWIMSLSDLAERGRGHLAREPGAFERVACAVRPDALATLIYTSGTTGRPKGVELTHDNWVYEAQGIASLGGGLLQPDDLQLLWLPLAHSFGKVLEVAQLQIGFTTAIDGRVDAIVENMQSLRPTFVAAVPRVFEKVYAKVMGQVQQSSALRQRVFSWARRVGHACSSLERAGERPGPWLAVQRRLADALVFGKLRARFGGRLRFFVSGSAPLSPQIAEFFHAAGILILEGYGLTESSAATVVNRPTAFKLGSVGLPLPGTEVKIADDGEILLKGRGIMRGYHGLDDATAAVLRDGWLCTGDIGELDEQGFLKITDRKKDLIKTSGGKYVAPQLLEGKLKALCPFVSHVIVHGDKRKFCSALLAFDPEAMERWAAAEGLSGSYAELAARPEARALLQPYVDELNAGLPRHSTIKAFACLPADLTLEAGELTTSLKVRRRVVEEKYRATLDELYRE